MQRAGPFLPSLLMIRVKHPRSVDRRGEGGGGGGGGGGRGVGVGGGGGGGGGGRRGGHWRREKSLVQARIDMFAA